jgi:hypothetical protein
LIKKHDEWTEGPRYLGLDIVARCLVRLITDTAVASEEVTGHPTIPARRPNRSEVTRCAT